MKKDQNRNMACRILKIGLILLVINSLHAQKPAKLLAEADSLIAIEQFNDALQIYDSLMSLGYQSTHLYQNTAYAAYKTENFGKARLFGEKAFRSKKGDDIAALIEDIQNTVGDEYTFPPIPGSGLLVRITSILGQNGIAYLLFITMVTMCVIIFAKRKLKNQNLFIYGMVGISILLLGILLMQLSHHRVYRSYFVLQSDLEMTEAPDDISATLLQLKAGFLIKVIDQIGDWKQIELADASKGWIDTKGQQEIPLQPIVQNRNK